MANLFNSEGANYIVSVAAKVAKAEKKIFSDKDSESLIFLYNEIEAACKILNSSIDKYIEKGEINE